MKAVQVALIVTIVLLGLIPYSCSDQSAIEEEETILTEVDVRLDDTIAHKILNFQDRFQTDSLRRYFDHKDPTYRYLAASAFASIRDLTYLDSLTKLLKDPIQKVRVAAAYSLGQLGDDRAEASLIASFQDHDSIDVNNILSCTILEAIGKCGRQESLPLLSQVSTYERDDHFLLLGQARAIYRFMLRGLMHESGTQQMVNLLADPDLPDKIRLVAAHYLSRADLDLTPHADVLSLTYETLADGEVKNVLPLALAKCKDKSCLNHLPESTSKDQDFRLKCNGLRAMAKVDFNKYRTVIQRSLYDKNIEVASTAANVILQYAGRNHWRTYMNLSLSNFPWQVKITLLHAVSKLIPSGNSMFEKMNSDFLQQRVRSTSNIYEEAAAIIALAEDPWKYSYVISHKKNSSELVVKSACTQALTNIATSTGFRRLNAKAQKDLIDDLVQSLESGDAGMVEIASGILDMDLQKYDHDLRMVLDRSIERLQLPRDMEAMIPLKKKLASLQGLEYDPNEDIMFTHAIDWGILDNNQNPTAKIQTTKGDFTVQLFPMQAPGTVSNFIDLTNLNYFTDKPFHRVVPGFVIQGGCNRGDGYGSMDYSIRSELSMLYYDEPGYLGMASAGNHTESAQWFVTQGAAPHLDGKYTLFGKVIEGIEIVYAMEVGDLIEGISVQ